MESAIIVHGRPGKEEYYSAEFPSCSNSHWIPWLQKQLIMRDIATYTPEIPQAWNPHYPIWKKEFERHDIEPTTMLVGHSCGAGFLIRWLSENPHINVDTVVLVAPWLDPEQTTDFFVFDIDTHLATRCKKLTIFNSDDDGDSIQASVRLLRENIPGINYRQFHNYGHFVLSSLPTNELPELLQELV